VAVGAESLIAPRIPRLHSREHDPCLHGVSATLVSSVALWVVAFAGYAWLGDRIVVGEHLVVFDAASRLAHAFFAFYDAPPKLAAIGFVWPPVSTLVFLPLAAVRSLASSTLALPLTSAAFAAGLLVVLNRTLALLEVPLLVRYALLAAFGLNPMIGFYAVNGMGEIVYLFFLMAGIHLLVRWYLSRDGHYLVLGSVPFTLAVLTRYELAGYLVVAALTIGFVTRRRVATAARREAALLGFLTPVVYGFGLWIFFNWLILGDPLFWLRNQAPGAGGQQGVHHVTVAHLALTTILRQVLELNFELFPFAVLMVPVMVAVWARRRDAMTVSLTCLLLTNAATTVAFMVYSKEPFLLQLRYNMRALPIAVVAAGWAICSLRRKRSRYLAGAVAVVGLAASLPASWHAMKTYRFQYEDNTFTQAISSGLKEDFNGKIAFGGYPLGILQERQTADYILSHVDGRHAILTDDALSLEVMMVSGHPERFLDRIDYGDARWREVLNAPFGHVRYFLLSIYPQTVLDYIQLRFPGIAKGKPWAHIVYANARYVLLSVPRCPTAVDDGLAIPAQCPPARHGLTGAGR
jgi:hypothetical protein